MSLSIFIINNFLNFFILSWCTLASIDLSLYSERGVWSFCTSEGLPLDDLSEN